jgi:hypothetical protein
MVHKVANVGLLSLVHHVMMLVNMKNVGWCYAVFLTSFPPMSKCMIVTLYDYRNRTVCPSKHFMKTLCRVGH